MARSADDVFRDALALDDEERERLMRMLNATPHVSLHHLERLMTLAGLDKKSMTLL